MKKICLLFTLLLSALVIQACGNKERLIIHSWGEYIDNDSTYGVNLVRQFEREFNAKVDLVPFDSNEAAITKMETESFDIVIPSEYAIEQLVLEDKIEEIDWDLVEGFTKNDITKPLKGLLDGLKDEGGFDFLKYAVPYFWGNVGFVYNKEKVSIEELEEYGWSIFKQPKFKGRVAYYDSSRDGFMVPLKDLGFSMNTTVKEEVDLAVEWLMQMKSNVDPSFKMDELLSEIPSMRYDLALIYSGDGLYSIMEADNDLLDFYVPKDTGTNVFCDGMVIPKNAKNKELAYKFISFMSRHENALSNSEYVCYSSSVNSAFEEIISEDGYFHDYDYIYNPVINIKDEIFRYNKEMKIELNQRWATFKASR